MLQNIRKRMTFCIKMLPVWSHCGKSVVKKFGLVPKYSCAALERRPEICLKSIVIDSWKKVI